VNFIIASFYNGKEIEKNKTKKKEKMSSCELLNSFIIKFCEDNKYPEIKEKWLSLEVQKELKEILKPKTKVSGHTLFMREKKAKLAKKYPNMNKGELRNKASELWHKKYNTPELRKKWIDLANKINSENFPSEKKEIEDFDLLEKIKTSCTLLDFVKKLKPKIQERYPTLGIKEVVTKIDNLWKYFKN